MKLLSLFFLFIGGLFLAYGQDSKQITSFEDVVLIDVRTPGEFKQGSVEGAINVPLSSIQSNTSALPNDKNDKIVVFCLSGSRSAQAKLILQDMGYTQVVNGGTYKQVGNIMREQKNK